jgi:hypothetical protein
LYDLAYQATPGAVAVIDIMARGLAASPVDWTTENSFQEAIARELGRAAARLGVEFDTRLRATRAAAAQALAAVRGETSEAPALPQPYARPLFDPAPLLAAARLSLAWCRWPVTFARYAALRHHLHAQLGGALDDAMRAYARTLVGWSERYLDELAAQFNAQAGFAEMQSAAPLAPREAT